MAPVTVTELVARNEKHVATHTPLPTIPEIATLGLDPVKIIIVSCADPRVIPEQIFGLNPGEALVIRVIAGHPQNAINDILALDAFLKLSDIIVVHHTDCGSTYFTEDSIRTELKSRSPHDKSIDTMTFGAVSTRFVAPLLLDFIRILADTSVLHSIQQNLVDDLKFLRSHPLMRKELVEQSRGFTYDIKTGKLEEAKV
jgi:carbonic anhydrase